MHDYDDIINIKHFEPKHQRMSMYNRSSQFAPFAALVGFSDQIEETSRITDKKIILDNEEKEKINNILINLDKNKEITIKYFVKDLKKDGGSYKEIKSSIKKIDYINKEIKLINNVKISLNDIISIKIE